MARKYLELHELLRALKRFHPAAHIVTAVIVLYYYILVFIFTHFPSLIRCLRKMKETQYLLKGREEKDRGTLFQIVAGNIAIV